MKPIKTFQTIQTIQTTRSMRSMSRAQLTTLAALAVSAVSAVFVLIHVVDLKGFISPIRSDRSETSRRLALLGGTEGTVVQSDGSTFPNSNMPNIPTTDNYSGLMIYYHKTGHVLTSALRNHIREELSQFPDLHNDRIPSIPFAKSVDPKNCRGYRIETYQTKQFDPATGCPAPFGLIEGCLYRMESPDLYCEDGEMERVLVGNGLGDVVGDSVGGRRGTKVFHFVRNPYSMALSNYFYHAQNPPPEFWTKHVHPCRPDYSGKDLIFPTLSIDSTDYVLTPDEFQNVVQLCDSLYQATPAMAQENYDSHLHKLPPFDGLRLSVAQFMINMGDMLRMANNIVRLRNMSRFLGNAGNSNNGGDPPLLLSTVAMDDFINDPYQFTLHYQKLLFGNHPLVNEGTLQTMARSMEARIQAKKESNNNHITSNKGKEEKLVLEEMLRGDGVLGPILDRIERLVEEALLESKQGW